MNIEEKAQEYAQNKMQQVLNDAVAEAYMEGYKQGYKDCQAKMPQEVTTGDVEYVDLGLPSGTLWAKKNLCVEKNNKKTQFIIYNEAKRYNLPSKEQFQELFDSCEIDKILSEDEHCIGVVFIAENGQSLKFMFQGYKVDETRKQNESLALYWIRDDSSDLNAFKIDRVRRFCNACNKFPGFGLQVRLVK